MISALSSLLGRKGCLSGEIPEVSVEIRYTRSVGRLNIPTQYNYYLGILAQFLKAASAISILSPVSGLLPIQVRGVRLYSQFLLSLMHPTCLENGKPLGDDFFMVRFVIV